MKEFVKNPANPVFGNEATGTMFDVEIRPYSGEPTTLKNPRLRMDVSWRPKSSLAVSFSEDGIHWTDPEITLKYDRTTGWEEHLNRNTVLKVGDTYKMWYTGQFLDHTYASIGYAESKDGIHFSRVPHAQSESEEPNLDPVIIAERNWEGVAVMCPHVVYENGKYRMYYCAGEIYEPNVIALAESEDGIHWRKDRVNPILIHKCDRDYEKDRVGACTVSHVEGLGYLMFYIGYRDIDTACICCALSKDGKTQWRRCKGNPLITPTNGEWDGDACYKPSALYDEEKNGWHIWYNGRKGCAKYIGKADYMALLRQYAASQKLYKDGRVINWIDENQDPFSGQWIARDLMYLDHYYHHPKERGAHYNHSTFCDLVLSGACGITPDTDMKTGRRTITVKPLCIGTWKYYSVKNLSVDGYVFDVYYDAERTKYGYGSVLTLVRDGKIVEKSDTVLTYSF